MRNLIEERGKAVRPRRVHWLRSGICLAMMTVFIGTAFTGQELTFPDPYHRPSSMNPVPDANDRTKINDSRQAQKNYDAVNAERKRRMAEDSANLLILARDLNAEANNALTGKLPERTVREAEVIEILARKVEARMELTLPSK